MSPTVKDECKQRRTVFLTVGAQQPYSVQELGSLAAYHRHDHRPGEGLPLVDRSALMGFM